MIAYHLSYKETSSSTFVLYLDDITSTTATVVGLTPATTYDFKV